MAKTTIDLIKILPFEEGFKNELIQKYDSLNEDQKFMLQQVVWETYYALYKLKLDENITKARTKLGSGEEDLGEDFYAKVRKQTEEELEQEVQAGGDKFDLNQAREKLQNVVDITPQDPTDPDTNVN